MSNYHFLHHKSHCSFGKAIGNANDIVQKAKEFDASIALTDRNTMSGIIEFYNAARKAEVDYHLGLELTIYDEDMTSPIGVVLIAKSQIGYRNLCRLVTEANRTFQTASHLMVDINTLIGFSEDLVCISDEIDWESRLYPIFNSDLYYEVVLDAKNNEKNKSILSKTSKYIVSLNSIKTSEFDEKLLKICRIDDNVNLEGNYLCSLKDMIKLVVTKFPYIGNQEMVTSISISNEIASKTKNIELVFTDQLVDYPHLLHPLNTDRCSKEELILRMIRNNNVFEWTQEYIDRLAYEMKVITQNSRINLSDYFLVVADTVEWCMEEGIYVGPGRGSGGGSLVNYGLKITRRDPVKNKLLFERFISEGRIMAGTLPDIDLDFSDPARVKEYWKEKYGHDRVVPIGTFQTLQTKSSVKDIWSNLFPEVPFIEVNKVTRNLPTKDQDETEKEYFNRCLKESKPFKDLVSNSDTKPLIEKLIGHYRQGGRHPCGQAITELPISDIAPMRFSNGEWCLEYTGDVCEQVGIIKYDALGLKTLKFIGDCCKEVGIADPWMIEDGDEKTYAAFKAGDTTSVFQFNSEISRNLLTQTPVNNIAMLTHITSLGRPGPMANDVHLDFIKLTNNQKKVEAPHPLLAEELKDNFGLMIYQENVMKAAQILGGFTMEEADKVRKAMGKKKPELLEKPKYQFITHALSKGYADREDLEHIWELMATFAGYGFNLSHADAYAYIGYVCQYLKTNYPLQWWKSCLANEDKPERIKEYYLHAKSHIMLPNVNYSGGYYSIANDKIQMPLTAVKFLGSKACDDIVSKQPFTSFDDFYERVNKTFVNVRIMRNLILGNAFEGCEHRSVQELVNLMYDKKGKDVPEKFADLKFSDIQIFLNESLDFLSMNYYDIFYNDFNDSNLYSPQSLQNLEEKVSVKVGGEVVNIINRKTKKDNKLMITFDIENDGASIQCVIFPKKVEKCRKFIEKKNIIKVSGTTSFFNGQVQVICDSVLLVK